MKKPKISIIVLSFNTKDVLEQCLNSLAKLRKEISFEVIVPDNGSSDESFEMVEKKFPWTKVIKIGENLGFAAGNNRAKPYATGENILFLNSDTVVPKNTLRKTVEYIENNKKVGALTCKIVLANGELDKDARRSFITPWIGLVHLVLKLDKVFPKSKLFAKYWYGYLSEDLTHEVDALQGAFFLVRKKILDKIGWFDESFFLDGEDLDLCWRIKEDGWKIIYYPKVKIIHYKGFSKGKADSKAKKRVPLAAKLKFRMAGVNSMELFYKKHLWRRYNIFINLIVLTGIKTLKLLRFTKTVIKG